MRISRHQLSSETCLVQSKDSNEAWRKLSSRNCSFFFFSAPAVFNMQCTRQSFWKIPKEENCTFAQVDSLFLLSLCKVLQSSTVLLFYRLPDLRSMYNTVISVAIWLRAARKSGYFFLALWSMGHFKLYFFFCRCKSKWKMRSFQAVLSMGITTPQWWPQSPHNGKKSSSLISV